MWGIWLGTCVVFFSRALFFHRYYLSMVAPPIAALFAIGAVALWQAYRGRGLRSWFLPPALLAMAAVQAYILRSYAGWNTWLTPIVIAPCVVAAVVLAIGRLPVLRRTPAQVFAGAAAFGMLALLVAPAVWSGDTVRNNAAAGAVFAAGPSTGGRGVFGGPGGPPGLMANRDGTGAALPSAGATGSGQALPPMPPGDAAQAGGPPSGDGGFGPGGGTSKQLEQFLLANQGSAKYLIAVSGAREAEQLILDTGKPVMAMGGFSGSDPILTADSFAALVKQGVVRFVLLGGMGGGTSGVSSWVQTNCTVVSTSQIQGSTPDASSTSTASGSGNQQVYDCAAANS
jgi:4-amino-4-deoxy-L-arabinose transferase-like glycosyltransferase